MLKIIKKDNGKNKLVTNIKNQEQLLIALQLLVDTEDRLENYMLLDTKNNIIYKLDYVINTLQIKKRDKLKIFKQVI